MSKMLVLGSRLSNCCGGLRRSTVVAGFSGPSRSFSSVSVPALTSRILQRTAPAQRSELCANGFVIHRPQTFVVSHATNNLLVSPQHQESRRFRSDGDRGEESGSSSSSWYLLYVAVAACGAGSASVASSNGAPVAATQTEEASKPEENKPPSIPELQAKKDLYGGMRVQVWLPLPASHAALIPIALSNGFDFHHADKGKVMLVAWLPDTPNHLPANASHQVGVGVCVIDAQDRILLVQERNGPAANRGKNFWKMPTGLVDVGEDIADAAVREVLEETGIRVKFEGVVAFRQHKVGMEGKTDLFFLCKASPLSSKIVKQDSEILKAEWMPVDKFLNSPSSAYWFMNKLAAESYLSHRKTLPGFHLLSPPAIFKPVELPRPAPPPPPASPSKL